MALSVYTPTGIVHETSVDFTKRVLAEPVHLVQYDASLPVLGVAVFDAGQYITLTASDTVSIRMDKGDGTFIYNPALGMSADGHKVYVQITEQMTVNYGRFEPVLELLRGNGYGCSSPVPLFIDKNPVPNAAIESTDEFQTIQSMYNTVVGFSDALDYLNTPEAQTDVANAEENATAAAQSASDAADSATDAAQSAENAAAAVDAVEFTQAATRENINSGESLSTIMGKVKKWFADLKNAAFHTVANNYTTTVEGYVLDARLGPAIKMKMDLADTLNTKVDKITYNHIENLSALIEFCDSMKIGEVRPIWIGPDIMNTIYGISSANGPGIVMKHTAVAVDLLSIDSIMRYCRFNPSNSTFTRKYTFTGVSVN